MIAKKQFSKCTQTCQDGGNIDRCKLEMKMRQWKHPAITSALPRPCMWMIHINADVQVFVTDCFWDISPSKIGHYTWAYPGLAGMSTSKWDSSLLLSQTCPKTTWEGRIFVFVDLPLLNSKAKLQKLGIINGWWKKFNFLDKKNLFLRLIMGITVRTQKVNISVQIW